MDNLSLQADEIEALSSIYDGDLNVEDAFSRKYSISVSNELKLKFDLVITLPDSYPNDSPPKYELHAPWLASSERTLLHQRLDRIYDEHAGENILYIWVEDLRDFLQSKVDHTELQMQEEVHEEINKINIPASEIAHGEPLTDRRSTFQAHVAAVTDISQVRAVRESLLQNRKIANATHNIMAYRIYNNANSMYLQDCDDDGETAAGNRMLHLLQILDVRDVVVVVSRWYGGIQLGPDRFKHINNVTRRVLVQEGYVDKN